MTADSKIEEFLRVNNISYTLHEHPAVYTCEEAERLCQNVPGLACKNLFLKNKKGSRYFLVILPAKNQVDLNRLAVLVGESRVSFASPERLLEKLGLTPGAVSPFGLLNNYDKDVEVLVSQNVDKASIVSFHPNRNTASLELTGEMFQKFLKCLDNKVTVVDL